MSKVQLLYVLVVCYQIEWDFLKNEAIYCTDI